METIKGDLVLTKNTTFDGDLKVEGNIRCVGGPWDINARDINARDINACDIDAWDINAWDINECDIDARDINARDINAWDINAGDIDARDIDARDINAWDINAWDIDARDINAWDIEFVAFAIARQSFKCKSWKGRRENHLAKCLDKEIEIVGDKICSKCGHKL